MKHHEFQEQAPASASGEVEIAAADERAGAEFEPFLTAREVAARLRIAPCTVLRYFDDGVLPGRRLRVGRGRPVRFRWSEIETALLEAQR